MCLYHMKKSELIFALLLIPIDFLMLIAAGVSAYFLRVGELVTDVLPIIFTLPFSQYLTYVLWVAVSWIMLFALAGMYTIKSDRRISAEFPKTVLACTAGIVVIIVAIFLQREFFSSRFIIIAAWVFSILYVTVGRIALLAIQRAFLIRGYGRHRIILIGSEKHADIIESAIRRDPKLGYEIIARFPEFSPAIAKIILEHHAQYPLDAIMQTDPAPEKSHTQDLMAFAEEYHITFKFIPDLFDAKAGRVAMSTIAGLPVFAVRHTRLEGWGRIYKRVFDIIVSLALIIVTLPIMLTVAIAIKLESRGPVLFKRRDDGSPVQRIGQHGAPFTYFKFRSMYDKTDSLRYSATLQARNLRQGPLVKIEDDPRITRVGKFIRRFSLDELPEFFLVLVGKMSLVGPRPHLPEEVAKYQTRHKRVLAIKPGITGLAQISGRSDLDFEDEVRLDTYYVEHWSLWKDIVILLKTPFIVLFGRRKAL